MTAPESWEQRISSRLTPDGDVVVPPRIAKWLQTRADIAPEWRAGLRDTDSEAYEVLMALYCAATPEISVCGTKPVDSGLSQPALDAWMTPAEVAEELGRTDRTVRNLCRTGKLPATWKGGGWLIRRTDLHTYRLIA